MRLLSLFLVLLLAAAPAFAEEEEPEIFDLDPVVVTGSWNPLKLSDSPANVATVPPQTVRRMRAFDAAELLPVLPSVFIRRSGPIGALSTVSVRGSASTEVQVMLDGRPLNQPSVGNADLSLVPADMIERAELARGPYSALYGPWSMSGALQLVTRKARPADGPGRLQLLAGGDGTNSFSGDLHFALGKSSLLVVPTVRNSRGNRPNSQSSLTAGFLRFDSPLGAEGRSLTLSGGFQSQLVGTPGPQPAAGVNLRTASQAFLGNDEVSSTVDHQFDRNGFLNAHVAWDGLEGRAWYSSWRPLFHFEYLDFANSLHMGDASTAQVQTGLDLRYRVADTGFTVGGSLENSTMDSTSSDHDLVLDTTTFSNFFAQRQVQSLYLEESLDLGPVALSLGARVDKPSDFPEIVSPRANLLWKVTDAVRLRGGWGRGYRPPTLFELNLPQTAFSGGNPDLRPQTSTSTEGGVEALISDVARLRFTAFREDSKDRIVFQPVGALGPFGPRIVPANLDRFRKVGWEAEVTVEPAPGWSLVGTHAEIDAVQVNQELVDAATNTLVPVERPAAQVPSSLSSVLLTWKSAEGAYVLVEGQWVGSMVNYYADFTAFPVVTQDVKRLPGFSVFDVVVSHPVRLGDFECDAFLKVSNLFDEQYSRTFGSSVDDRNFPMPGRTIFFGISPRL